MKVGLALSGGGIKGAAHAGVLMALKQENIPVDIISGTSAGSIVAALYSIGYSPEDLRDTMDRFDRRILDLNIRGLINGSASCVLGWNCTYDGIFRGNALYRLMNRLTGGRRMTDAGMPLAIATCELNDGTCRLFTSQPMEKDTEFYHYTTQASIAEAVTASAAIPIVFRPRQVDGVSLVDGGVVEYLPVHVLRKMGATVTIGVDLSMRNHINTKPDDIIEIGYRTFVISSQRLNQLQAIGANVLIAPDVSGIGTFSFSRTEDCYRIGYEEAMRQMPQLRKKIMDKAI